MPSILGAYYQFFRYSDKDPAFNIIISKSTIKIESAESRHNESFSSDGATFNGLKISVLEGLSETESLSLVRLNDSNWDDADGRAFDSSRVTFTKRDIFVDCRGLRHVMGFYATLEVFVVRTAEVPEGESVEISKESFSDGFFYATGSKLDPGSNAIPSRRPSFWSRQDGFTPETPKFENFRTPKKVNFKSNVSTLNREEGYPESKALRINNEFVDNRSRNMDFAGKIVRIHWLAPNNETGYSPPAEGS